MEKKKELTNSGNIGVFLLNFVRSLKDSVNIGGPLKRIGDSTSNAAGSSLVSWPGMPQLLSPQRCPDQPFPIIVNPSHSSQSLPPQKLCQPNPWGEPKQKVKLFEKMNESEKTVRIC